MNCIFKFGDISARGWLEKLPVVLTGALEDDTKIIKLPSENRFNIDTTI